MTALWVAGDMAAAMGGAIHGPVAGEVGGLSIDTRSLKPGEAFFALRGEGRDGHDYVAEALKKGAALAVIAGDKRPSLAPEGGYISVDEPLAALNRLAAAARQRSQARLVAVTGSVGKTSTKEALKLVLSASGPTHAAAASFNNHIGVPLTLLRLEPLHRSAVVEMGANRAGDVAELVAIARPSVGLVTNAGDEHLEGFGSLEGVARAEGEMFSALATDGTAVINADDDFAPLWREIAGARRVVTFGVAARADVRALAVEQRVDASRGALEFTLKMRGGEARVRLQLLGRHNVINALAAAAAASAAGASLEQCVRGLESVRAVRGRLDLKVAANGATIIDDSYNANPSSARAAIDVLADGGAESWLVLGEMAELGDFAVSSHADIGRYAREHGVRRLFAMGELTRHTVESFGPGAEWFSGIDALIARVESELTAGVTLLVKGSRVNRLERAVEALTRSKFMKTA